MLYDLLRIICCNNNYNLYCRYINVYVVYYQYAGMHNTLINVYWYKIEWVHIIQQLSKFETQILTRRRSD